MKEKSYVADIERSLYDFRNEDKDNYRLNAGLTPEIVEKISKEKERSGLDGNVPPSVSADL